MHNCSPTNMCFHPKCDDWSILVLHDCSSMRSCFTDSIAQPVRMLYCMPSFLCQFCTSFMRERMSRQYTIYYWLVAEANLLIISLHVRQPSILAHSDPHAAYLHSYVLIHTVRDSSRIILRTMRARFVFLLQHFDYLPVPKRLPVLQNWLLLPI